MELNVDDPVYVDYPDSSDSVADSGDEGEIVAIEDVEEAERQDIADSKQGLFNYVGWVRETLDDIHGEIGLVVQRQSIILYGLHVGHLAERHSIVHSPECLPFFRAALEELVAWLDVNENLLKNLEEQRFNLLRDYVFTVDY